jgi:hypothetical protein
MIFVSLNSNTTGVTCGAGSSSLSGIPEFTTGFYWELCCSIFSFLCNVFCRSLFVLFPLAIVLPVLLRFTSSDYPFGIFKLFICDIVMNETNGKTLSNIAHWSFSGWVQCRYFIHCHNLCICVLGVLIFPCSCLSNRPCGLNISYVQKV